MTQLHTAHRRRHTWRLLAAFAAVYLIWGSTYLGIRFAIETIPPLLMIGARNFVAGAVLYIWMRFRGASVPVSAQWRAALAGGLLFFLMDHGALAWAEQRVASGLAALLCATLPLIVAVIARLMGQEKHLSARAIVGLFSGLAGVALLVGPDALSHGVSTDLLGCAVILLGVTAWGVGSLYGRAAALPSSPVLSAGMQMMLGGGALLIAGLLAGEGTRFRWHSISARSLLSLAYLITFGSIVAFTAFLWLLKVAAPSRVATYAYVNPVVALLLGSAFAGEVITARTWAAAAIILAGVALVNSAKIPVAATAGKSPGSSRAPLAAASPLPQAASPND